MIPNLAKEILDWTSRADVRVDAHPHYHGYCVRHDGWGSRAWTRPDAYHVIYVCTLGELRYWWRDCSVTVTPGQAMLIGADLRPRVQWSEHAELWEIWIKCTPPLPPSPAQRKIHVLFAPPEAAGLIERLSDEAMMAGSFHQLPLLRPRLHLLLALLAQEAGRALTSAPRTLTPRQRIRLVRWAREHLADPPTPADLAREAGLTLDYFARLFQATFGRPPRDWLVLERALAARRLLDDGASIANAMRLTGFHDAAHFGRTIKKLTGRTPGGRSGWLQQRKTSRRPATR